MNLIKLNATGSTNNYLKNLVKEVLPPDETLVVALEQTAGRGQMGAGWVSKQGISLTFSVFKCFKNLKASDQFAISMVVSLALKEALSNLGMPQVFIKWPNDILSVRKKLCGVLIENVLEGALIKYSIIGVGLNVNETAFKNLPQATSMYLEKGSKFDLDEVLTVVAKAVFKNLEDLELKDFHKLKEQYERNLFRKDVISVFENPQGHRFNGIIKGVSNFGELLVETESNSLNTYQLKELKLIY